MSEKPAPSAPASPPPAPPAPPARAKPPSSKPPAPPRRRGGALGVLALILALIALGCVAFGGWQWWQWRGHRQADAKALTNLDQRVTALAASVASARQDRADDQKVRESLHATNQALGQRLDGVSTRVDSLEDAVAGLARHRQQGRRAMLLDQAELLLRMGKERYELFHDASGALKAYALADQSLAAVDDPAFAGVRRTLAAARKALAATHPAARVDDLATLAQLRSRITQLPLKPLDADAGTPASEGFWHRIWRAVSTAIVVHRADGSPHSRADARLTRQLAALDVAQAQAARLAWDGQAFQAALKRVDQALATAFDGRDAGVRQARAEVARMLAEPVAGAAPTQIGKALTQLRNVRAVAGLQGTTPAAATSAPAPVTSAPAPATSTSGSSP